MAFSDRLKEIRKAYDMSQVELANKLNVAPSTIAHWELGTRQPNFDIINSISSIFDVTTDYLIGITTVPNGEVVTKLNIMKSTVPVYGHIPAGTPFEAIEDIIEEVSIPDWLAKKKDLFGLKVVGDSMNKVLPDGCIAVLQKTNVLDNGDIGAILVNGYDATIKKFFKLTDSIVLEPLSFNPDHKPIIIENGQETVVPIGKLLWYCAPRDF
jgi:repressor LexA